MKTATLKKKGKSMIECISHTGLYDDLDNPLTDDGQPYLPGNRLCGNRDCVQLAHIKGQTQIWIPNSRSAFHRALALEIHAKADKIGLTGYARIGSPCLMDHCEKPVKARGLCINHYSMFRHHNDDKLRKQRILTLADFGELPNPLPRKDRFLASSKNNNCSIQTCQRSVKCRGLCSMHYATYKRLIKETA